MAYYSRMHKYYLRYLRTILFLGSIPFYLMPSFSFARWATKDDMGSVLTNDEYRIDIKKNGSYTVIRKYEERILNDSARKESGIFQTIYNSQTSKFRFLQANTTLGKKKYPVHKEFIQDKPLASSQNGFDQMNQAMVAFPQLEVGSSISLSYAWDVFQVPFEGHYSQSIVFGDRDYNEKKKITFRSELPLFYEVNDPENYLKIVSGKTANLYTLSISLRRPIVKIAIDETSISLDAKNFPWVDISTQKSWAEVVRPILPAYKKIFDLPLPRPFQEIADSVKNEENLEKKINKITAQLAAKMHYLGDWRPINGGHIPRSLEKIAQTNFGDCKDFSAVLTAILRSLGLPANIAFIYRGINPIFSPNSIPNIDSFNHAIVWLKQGEKEYWIDPTNPVSFAQGIMEDIIDREALVLDPLKPFISHTPQGLPQQSRWEMESTFTFQNKDSYIAKGSLAFLGRAATAYTGAELFYSKKSIDYKLISSVGFFDNMKSWQIFPYTLQSRIVDDFRFYYEYKENNISQKTTAGTAFPLSSPWIAKELLIKRDGRVSDLFLGAPLEMSRIFEFKNIKPVGKEDLSCSIESPWIDFKRDFLKKSSWVKIRDTVRLKKSTIKIDEILSKEFEQLQEKIHNCLDSTAIIYEFNP